MCRAWKAPAPWSRPRLPPGTSLDGLHRIRQAAYQLPQVVAAHDMPADLVAEHAADADVRVAMAAVALNFPDLLMTRGLYQFKPPVPHVPGMEGTGTVVEAGPASGWQVGDRVGLGGKHGLLAEQVVVPGASLRALPAGMPVVTIAPNDALLEKLKSNLQEVRARGGELFVFADTDTQIQSEPGVHVIRMPEHYGALSPILHVVPLQLLAYHTACARGTDVDKPRNLAKSVTVE